MPHEAIKPRPETAARPLAEPASPPPARAPYAPGDHWLWGMGQAFWRDPARVLGNLLARYPEVVQVRFGPLKPYIVNHPDLAREVLRQDVKLYRPLDAFYDIVKQVAGLNLFTAEGAYWRQQRALMSPAFHRKHIAQFAAIITDEAHKVVAQWRATAGRGEMVDVKQAMLNVALTIIGRSLFSLDMRASQRGRQLSRALTFGGEYIPYRLEHPLTAPLFIPTPMNLRYWRARLDAYRIIQALIQERRRRPDKPHDFLQLLMNARYEDSGETMSDEQLLNEVRTFFFAGHESSGMTLAWVFYHLSQSPHVEEKLHAELAGVLAGRTPTADDLPRLSYTQQIVEEATRLHPPGWVLLRESLEPTTLGRYTAGAGAPIILATYNLHRHPDYWERPEQFYPERFDPANKQARKAYFAFGSGPRNCIGSAFAMMEATLLVATIAQQVRLETAPDYVARQHFVFPLGIEGPLPMRVMARRP